MKNIFVLTTVFFCGLQFCYSQAGKLDLSFGTNGIIKTAVTDDSIGYNSTGYQVLVNSDGGVYVIGKIKNLTAIARRLPDGSADNNYGVSGFVFSKTISYANAALQTDGKLVIAGSVISIVHDDSHYVDDYQTSAFGVARFNTDGNVDSTFGTNGIVTTKFEDILFHSSGADYCSSIAIQTDGKIVAAGSTFHDPNNNFAIARYNSDGSLDNTFDGDGKQTLDLTIDDRILALALQSDGKIVVTGIADFNVMVVRYKSDGALDDNFADHGKLYTDLQPPNAATSLAVQNDGKILVAGAVRVSDYDTKQTFSIARYNNDGSIDESFSGEGKQTIGFGFGDEIGCSIAVQNDGKILFAGYAWNANNYDFALARYNIDGTPDNSFSGDGKITKDFNARDDYAYSLAIQSDGKIIIAGTDSTADDGSDFALARYTGDGILDNTFDGTLHQHFQEHFFTPDPSSAFNKVTVQSDGKIITAGYEGNTRTLNRYNPNGSLDNTFSADGKLSFTGTPYSLDMIAGKKISLTVVDNNSFSLTTYNTNGNISDVISKNVGFNIASLIRTNNGNITVAGGIVGKAFSFANYNGQGNLVNTFTRQNNFNIVSIAIQADGKVIIAGKNFELARYRTNGTLDNNFTGEETHFQDEENPFAGIASLLSIQADGKIVVAGITFEGFAIARYNSNGSLDSSFSDDGKQTTDILGEGTYNVTTATSIITKHNKIILSGAFSNSRYDPTLYPAFAIYNPDGKYVKSGGEVSSAAVQNDGKLVLALKSIPGTFNLRRYKSDLSFDNSFNFQSAPITSFNDQIEDIAISGNKLYAVGDGQYVTGGSSVGIIASYLLNNENTLPPTVTISSPANDTTYIALARIKLNAAASDADGSITKVEFYNGATLIHTETEAPYDCIIDSAGVGSYLITSKAYDNDGNVTTSAALKISVIANTLPTVAIKTPLNNANFTAPANVVLTALANDADGRITKLEFYNGSTLIFTEIAAPYERKWFHLKVGSYTITAKAYDNKGGVTTSAPVNFSVVPDIAPLVSITSPANGTNFTAPANIELIADASDIDGTIKTVDFYNGSTLLFTEKYLPYSNTWANVPEGNYSITAVATDNNGKSTTSAPVAISVGAVPSPMARGGKLNLSNKPLSLNVNPNPVAKILNISIEGLQTNNQSAISLLSASGALIKTIQSNVLNKNIQLDVSSLSTGVYFIKVINGGKILYKQFIKL